VATRAQTGRLCNTAGLTPRTNQNNCVITHDALDFRRYISRVVALRSRSVLMPGIVAYAVGAFTLDRSAGEKGLTRFKPTDSRPWA
jgi:hypothetical protein